jgi:glycosyltransferase involved in cell wall biosynthesis
VNQETGEVDGWCDGIRGGRIYGWAWRSSNPDEFLDIEVFVDGVLVGATVASDYRPDLRAGGFNHGRYGWSLALDLDLDRTTPFGIVARVKGDEPLKGGVFEYSVNPPLSDYQNEELLAFVASALEDPREVYDQPAPVRERPTINFLLYCPVPASIETLGAAEYSYGFVLNAFRPVLEQLGCVHMVVEPAVDAEKLYAEQVSRGENSVLLSFAPPHRTPLGLRCPVIPVIAWEFPTIPNQIWDGEVRNDWRFVLRQTGRAMTLSHFAAAAVRAGLGATYPVAAVPAPVWDRYRGLRNLGAPTRRAELQIKGFVFDTAGRRFPPAEATPPQPPPQADDAPLARWTPSGVIFTSVFAPKDGRKNWLQIVTAFIAAHRHRSDATLVLKIVGADAAYWWWEFHDALQRQHAFDCRIIVLHGYLDEANYFKLIEASHWVVNASLAEGLCLPLLEFMSAGRPAIAPRHTAMADYIDKTNAILVESDEEFCGWPHDPVNTMTTTRHRIDWTSLVDAYEEAYQLVTTAPDHYVTLASGAAETMDRFCSDEVVARQLDAFLGLNQGRADAAPSPSLLMRTIAE